ncbi:MAG TPA: type II secretion system F family protein, partial [Aquabacterium sp.]|nr:type II secretion system F family protein [Aquabacterium sp.]
MPRYSYRAINEGGAIVKGEITALHESDLQAQLTASGLSLIRYSTVRSGGLRLTRLPTRELINLLFHMQMLLRAGVPLIGALQDLRDG